MTATVREIREQIRSGARTATEVTRAAMDQLVVDNILAWAAGKPPLTPVPETPWPPKRS